MPLNLTNFLKSKEEKSKMADFQDLDHLDEFRYLLLVQIYIIKKEMI